MSGSSAYLVKCGSKACGKLLFRTVAPFVVEVKCSRCGEVWLFKFDQRTGDMAPVSEVSV